MSKVVVTGGAGFIGSHLCDKLVELGHEVVVIDNFSSGRRDNLAKSVSKGNVRTIDGDVCDTAMLEQALRGSRVVFHLAAMPNVQRSVEDPVYASKVNVEGTVKVLSAAMRCLVEKVIYASTSSVYGGGDGSPMREDMLPHPETPYAASKLAGEAFCSSFNKSYGLQTVCLRYFSVYGSRQSTKQGTESGRAPAVASFLEHVLNHKSPTVYGDGAQTRDFTHVSDIVLATLLAMRKSMTGVYNVATGRSISVTELLNSIRIVTGVRVEPVYASAQAIDVKYNLADIAKIRQQGYIQTCADILEGLKETVNGYKGQ